MKKEGLYRQRRVVLPFHYSKGKRLVQVVVLIKDDPGALASVLGLIGGQVNLVGSTSYQRQDGLAVFSAMAEELVGRSAEDVRQAVLLGWAVLDCQVWEGNDGLLVDMFHTGLSVGLEESYMMIPTGVMAKMFENVVKKFGSGGEAILFYEGKDFARARFEHYKKMLGPKPADKIEVASHLYEAMGYGTTNVVPEGSDGAMRITQKDCFECSGSSKNGRTCAFTRGLAAGSIGAALGKDMECTETRCRLKGDPACEFLVVPLSRRS